MAKRSTKEIIARAKLARKSITQLERKIQEEKIWYDCLTWVMGYDDGEPEQDGALDVAEPEEATSE